MIDVVTGVELNQVRDRLFASLRVQAVMRVT